MKRHRAVSIFSAPPVPHRGCVEEVMRQLANVTGNPEQKFEPEKPSTARELRLKERWLAEKAKTEGDR